jgi:hypothetical protein
MPRSREAERFAQEALGHNSKAVHRAYAKRALMKLPSLGKWIATEHRNNEIEFMLTIEGSKPNDTVTTINGVVPLGKKRDAAKVLNVCVRSMDNYIAEGCPVIKPSPRCCRFDLAEVKVWFKEKYGQQSRKSYSKN